MTSSVISNCGAQSFNTDNTGGDTYLGGGTNIGTWQRTGGNSGVAMQAISPMSRALGKSEFCALATTVYGGTVPESSGATEGLLVGIDGVSMVQGSGNVALGGCGASGGDACTNFPLTDINGVTVPEATETFGP